MSSGKPVLVRALGLLFVLLFVLLFAGGCSLRRFAVNRVGDLLTSSSSSTFETDDDLELVGEALPFSLKLLESLIAESPQHAGLRLAACRGFTLYAYGWVDFEAEVAWEEDVERARRLAQRAGRLYLRAHEQCRAGLESSYPGLTARLQESGASPGAALAAVGARPKDAVRDLPLLYWTAASLGLAISSSRSDVTLLARLPEAEALAARAFELDPGWHRGALHELSMSLLAAAIDGPDYQAIERHYQEALALSGGHSPGLFVSYAELVAVPKQDADLFRTLLRRALEIDPAADPETQLQATLAQRRAAWLLGRVEDLILEGEGLESTESTQSTRDGRW
jgi:predicted anti-sigma-YlaC factor YlaD